MEKTKKLIFSTKESLKWGFILGCVALFLPLWIFGADNYQCGNNTYTDFLELATGGNWGRLCFNEGDLNIADTNFYVQNKAIGFLFLKTALDYQLELTKQEPNPQLAFQWCFDAERTNCQSWSYWNNYYLNNFEFYLELWDYFYSTQAIKNAGGTIIYTSEFLEAELRVFGVSPASGSTATSTDEDFVIGWEDWDFEWIYKDFVFSFYEKNTGILTGMEIYEPMTENGTTTFKFSRFGIDKNGEYYFHAKARSYLYEYTAFYTGDLVYPEWWVNIQVEGWPTIFEMPAFETWYSENSKFATPTATFSGVAGLLSPIYNKIGEFGDRVITFLDLNEAYDRGYDLGKVLPTFRHYISQIEIFFGGFPIIQIFLAFLVILLGIFIVRLILKFIPGLG